MTATSTSSGGLIERAIDGEENNVSHFAHFLCYQASFASSSCMDTLETRALVDDPWPSLLNLLLHLLQATNASTGKQPRPSKKTRTTSYPTKVTPAELELLRWTLAMRRIESRLTRRTREIAQGVWPPASSVGGEGSTSSSGEASGGGAGEAEWAQKLHGIVSSCLYRNAKALTKFDPQGACWDSDLLFRGLWKHDKWLAHVAKHYDLDLASQRFQQLKHLAESIEGVRYFVAHPAPLPGPADLAQCLENAEKFMRLLLGLGSPSAGCASSSGDDLTTLSLMVGSKGEEVLRRLSRASADGVQYYIELPWDQLCVLSTQLAIGDHYSSGLAPALFEAMKPALGDKDKVGIAHGCMTTLTHIHSLPSLPTHCPPFSYLG